MNPYRKVAFHTLGCKLNFSESNAIAKQFQQEGGFAKVNFEEIPDVFVINTCSVTEQADKKCRNVIHRAKRINPHAFVVVIGCYAQLKPEEIGKIPGVNLVLGANEKFNILSHLEDLAQGEVKVVNEHIKTVKTFVPAASSGDRTRSFLKVQDGCDYFCAFCTIPLARGRSRSSTVNKTVAEAKKLADQGIKEVVLTGINLGDFGKGTTENFYDLIQALDEVSGISRFRISSIEPNLLSDEIIAFVAQSKKFAPHFHIPLQSGSDQVLAAMRRKYDCSLYRKRIEKIKSLIPDCCIGVDVIVGFPGESESAFQQTYQFLHDLDVSYLHVFTYSERQNTTALRLRGSVPLKTRQERSKKLRQLSAQKRKAFYLQNMDKHRAVIFETTEENGMVSGYTDNYIRVAVPGFENHNNQLATTQIIGLVDKDLALGQRISISESSAQLCHS